MDEHGIIGFVLRCPDNDSYMFPADMSNDIRKDARRKLVEYAERRISGPWEISDEFRRLNRCPLCGYRLDFQPHNNNYSRGKRQLDLGCTYDGQFIASAKFKAFCGQRLLENIEFKEFTSDRTCFHLIAHDQVAFDSARRRTRFEWLCPTCGNYESVVGADPAYLKVSALPRGIFRSDLVFASGNEKHPILIASTDVKLEMEQSGLNGLEFSLAFGS